MVKERKLTNTGQMGLFSSEEAESSRHDANFSNNSNDLERSQSPLAYKARPDHFEDYCGHEQLFKRYPFLKSPHFPSLVLWGPPGTGKTTLAHILASRSNKEIYRFNAVLGGVNDLKKLIKSALEIKEQMGTESVIFIDEIHRFNKSQQDALLPYVEAGDFTLVGATTENPRSSVNRALISRVHIIELKKLNESDLFKILERAKEKFAIPIDRESLEFIADYSNGDARNALNTLDIILQYHEDPEIDLTLKDIKPLILENGRDYDRNKDRHYDVISAFIKSMRGSDPDSALLWLAVMLDGGEDPVFIARRLVIFASEDVGNADPSALSLAQAALQTVQNIGMPEARISLAQATTYLASTVKSNAAYKSIDEALAYVKECNTIEVPLHLRNYPPKDFKGKYLYPHAYPGNFVDQKYTNEDLPAFYRPSENGREKLLKDRLEKLWRKSRS